MLLAGCTSSSNAIANVFLFSITSRGGEGTLVHAGYFSLCAKEREGSQTWICSSSMQGLQAVLGGTRESGDQLNVMDMAGRFRTGLVFPGLMSVLGVALHLRAQSSTLT